jgi:uncharacterized protein
MGELKYPDARILVFCKAPIPGKVKTRLLPALSAKDAADLYKRLAYRMIDCSLKSNLAPIELYCYPDTCHEFFSQFPGLDLLAQQGDDLGERMCEAARSSLAQNGVSQVLIIGADCPTLDQNYLELALDRLDCHDAVLGPAEDGGYGLIGLKTADPYLFSHVHWSTSEVCAQTSQRMNDLDYNWSLLPLLWDVDRPEDLERLNHA